ncbi:MAG TPA: hypothetical protein VK992_00315 [Candidatus Caenarcaniphilales bacterium]|nr:hypothetical protein [Candidatus Caenarcaniphilales bacterium]
MQKFLGHSDPGFTLRRYVHLLPEDLPETSFLDDVTAAGVGNAWATGTPETTGNVVAADAHRDAAMSRADADSRRQPEVASGN